MEWHRLREEERGQKGERNLGGYFVELGRATGNSGQIKSPDERNKIKILLRSKCYFTVICVSGQIVASFSRNSSKSERASSESIISPAVLFFL